MSVVPPTKREFLEQTVAVLGVLTILFGLVYFLPWEGAKLTPDRTTQEVAEAPVMDASLCLYLGSALKGNKTQVLKCEFERLLCILTLYPGTDRSSISCVPAVPTP